MAHVATLSGYLFSYFFFLWLRHYTAFGPHKGKCFFSLPQSPQFDSAWSYVPDTYLLLLVLSSFSCYQVKSINLIGINIPLTPFPNYLA